MKDWQERLMDERTALDDKLLRLELFIKKSDVYEGLDKDDKQLLLEQRDVMQQYSEILDKRIRRIT